MKDYYKILDVPVTATREEIKTQYRQLVRMHHPDLFRDATDKVQAEERLKQINIAFQVLSGKMIQPTPGASTPLPVVYPPILDFGAIRPGAKATLSLQVNNMGGIASNVALRFCGDSRLFRISKGKRVYGDRAFPLNYAISAHTRRMAPDTAHRGWIEVDLDGIVTQVELALHIKDASPRQLKLDYKRLFSHPKRWALVLLIILLSGLLGAALPMMNPQFTLYRLLPTDLFVRPFYLLQSDELLFSSQESPQAESSSVLYVGGTAGQTLTGLGIDGQSAVGSAARQQVAYLGRNGEIYLLDLQTGQPAPLTHDGAPKRALAWSADGARLAYLVGEGKSASITIHDFALGTDYTVPDAATTALAGVSTGVNHYAWSPSDDILLFDLWEGEERRVYRIGAAGADLQQLTHFDSWGATWSADGQAVVVSSSKGIYQLNAHGAQLTLISNVAGELPSWSADGKWLAYVVQAVDDPRQALWIMDLASGQTIQVADETVRYAWGASGDLLGYVTGVTTTETPLLYLWTVTPGDQPQLVAEVTDPFFQWIQ